MLLDCRKFESDQTSEEVRIELVIDQVRTHNREVTLACGLLDLNNQKDVATSALL